MCFADLGKFYWWYGSVQSITRAGFTIYFARDGNTYTAKLVAGMFGRTTVHKDTGGGCWSEFVGWKLATQSQYDSKRAVFIRDLTEEETKNLDSWDAYDPPSDSDSDDVEDLDPVVQNAPALAPANTLSIYVTQQQFQALVSRLDSQGRELTGLKKEVSSLKAKALAKAIDKSTSSRNLARLVAPYRFPTFITPEVLAVLSTDARGKIVPKFLRGDTEAKSIDTLPLVAGGTVKKGTRYCSNLFVYDGNRPVCALPKLDDSTGFILSETVLGGHILLTRFSRDQDEKAAARGEFHQHTICKSCVGDRSGFVFEKASQCRVCLSTKNITRANGKDSQIELCGTCFDLCGSKDFLDFALRPLKELFPSNDLVITKTRITGTSLTPDTTITFTDASGLTTFYVLIEQDTDQHAGVREADDTAKNTDMAKAIYAKDPNARVFIVRFNTSGVYTGILGGKESNSYCADRLVVLRQWVTFYVASCLSGNVPPFAMLYLWYNFSDGESPGSKKVTESIKTFGRECVGQAYGSPKGGGPWKWYALYPLENAKCKFGDGLFDSEVGDVFPHFESLDTKPEVFVE